MRRDLFGWFRVSSSQLSFATPPGLDHCGTCGELRGTTRAQWVASLPYKDPLKGYKPQTVRCACTACRKCGRTIRSREPRPTVCPKSGLIRWTNGDCLRSHICPQCGSPSGPSIDDLEEAEDCLRHWWIESGFRPVDDFDPFCVCIGSLQAAPRSRPRLSFGAEDEAAEVPQFLESHYWIYSIFDPRLICDGPGAEMLVLDGRNSEVVFHGKV